MKTMTIGATHLIWDSWGAAVKLLTAENLLLWKANSGAVILARSIWTSAWIMVIAITGNTILDNGFSWGIHPHLLLAGFKAHPTWYALIFAAVYTALYTRFAAQWKYLADLYNAQKSVMVNISKDNRTDDDSKTALANWKVGFVADAEALHLCSKDLFGNVVATYLKESEVKEIYDRLNGAGSAAKLLERVNAG